MGILETGKQQEIKNDAAARQKNTLPIICTLANKPTDSCIYPDKGNEQNEQRGIVPTIEEKAGTDKNKYLLQTSARTIIDAKNRKKEYTEFDRIE